MTLPASGAISLNQVNVELGLSGTASINMGAANVRGLFGVASGAISMSNGYGKANSFNFSITTNQTNANLRTLAVNAGWDQSVAVVATINGGVSVSGSVAGNSTAALTINGTWPGGITLVNNGTIRGRGGNGGAGGFSNGPSDAATGPGIAGSTGGRALLVSVACSINNASGVIQGGGGGGGGGGASSSGYSNENNSEWTRAAAGGGGGGYSSAAGNSSGGAAGTGGQAGTRGGGTANAAAGGGGTANSLGNGGGGGVWNYSNIIGSTGGTGGAGGNLGASGATGQTGQGFSNGGNSQGPNFRKPGGGGGAAGQAVSGNANVTWISTGTRTGPLV